jgi:dipeptidyl aminopeptidase/acylaminoacyl peptidase
MHVTTLALLLPVLAPQAPPFTAEDMLDVVQISGSIAVSPAGTRLAYVLPDLTHEWNVMERSPVGYVHVQDLRGSDQPLALTSGSERTSNPVWSPDGSRLAFFVQDEAGRRIAVWDGTTVRRYGSRFSGQGRLPPRWAGNTRLVYTRELEAPPPADPPRVQVVRSTDQRIPGDAFFSRPQQQAQLATVDLESGEERLLVEDPTGLRQFQVSPDGRYVLAHVEGETHLWPLDPAGPPRTVAGRGLRVTFAAEGMLQYRRGDRVYAFSPDEKGPAEGGNPQRLPEDRRGGPTNAQWSPDREFASSLVEDPSITDPEIEPPQPGMYTIARPFMDLHLVSASDGTTTNLTADIDDQISAPVWSTDGEELFFRAVDIESYDETIYRYSVGNGELTALLQGQESYGRLTPFPGSLLLTIQSAVRPPDLWLIDTETGQRHRVTDLNPQLERFQFSKPELFHYHSADGDRLGALLYKPAGIAADTGFPVITYVYEKLTPGIHRFNARNQIFLTHGYGLLMPNVKVVVGETGTSFVKCVVPAVNAVRAMGITNDKFALWGGSFGAYATSYVITQTNIFDCAVSRATPPELFRNWASGRDRDSDNIESGQARMGGSPFEVMERYFSQSAFFHLDKVETPVLIMHGVKDYTILFGEGEMMFYALRRLGKEATFVIYNEGDHSLSRHSRTDTLDVNRRMLAWFEKYLTP